MAYTIFDRKDMDIICPSCKKVVVKADKRDYHKKYIKCAKCNILVFYTPATKEISVDKVPPRKSSSGKRFY